MKITTSMFKKAKILVAGDIMLDRYLHGAVLRISPEAPVPVVHIRNVEERIGGAGNVALNIASLGGHVSLLGLVGEDDAARLLKNLLEKEHMDNYLLRVFDNPTIIKTRVIGQNQQLIRLDVEEYFEKFDKEAFFSEYEKRLDNSDVIIFSDYAKGTLSQIKKLIRCASKTGKIILVDPKGEDFSIYSGATIITPNFSEFQRIVGACNDNKEIEVKALKLLDECAIQAILITRGSQGMSLISKNQPVIHLSARAHEVYDVTGAGDSVIATLGVAMAVGKNLSQAMEIANIVAGLAVKKLGATPVSISELCSVMQYQ